MYLLTAEAKIVLVVDAVDNKQLLEATIWIFLII